MTGAALDLDGIRRSDRMADDPENVWNARKAILDRRALLAAYDEQARELAEARAALQRLWALGPGPATPAEHWRVRWSEIVSALDGPK